MLVPLICLCVRIQKSQNFAVTCIRQQQDTLPVDIARAAHFAVVRCAGAAQSPFWVITGQAGSANPALLNAAPYTSQVVLFDLLVANHNWKCSCHCIPVQATLTTLHKSMHN